MKLIDVPLIARKINYTEDTVRRYFRKRVFHAHGTGSDGVSLFSHEESIDVRFAALQRIRPSIRSLDRIGRAFRTVGGDDDQFIMQQVKAGVDIEAVAHVFIAKVREVSGISSKDLNNEDNR